MKTEQIAVLISTISQLSQLVQTGIQTAKQAAELTPEQEADFQARLAAAQQSPAWQPRVDGQTAPSPIVEGPAPINPHLPDPAPLTPVPQTQSTL